MAISIELAQEKKETISSEILRNKLEIILKSINDWPFDVNTFDEYSRMVGDFLGKPTTKDNINSKLKKINLESNAWEAESLFQIVLIFDFYEEKLELNDIFTLIKTEILG